MHETTEKNAEDRLRRLLLTDLLAGFFGGFRGGILDDRARDSASHNADISVRQILPENACNILYKLRAVFALFGSHNNARHARRIGMLAVDRQRHLQEIAHMGLIVGVVRPPPKLRDEVVAPVLRPPVLAVMIKYRNHNVFFFNRRRLADFAQHNHMPGATEQSRAVIGTFSCESLFFLGIAEGSRGSQSRAAQKRRLRYAVVIAVDLSCAPVRNPRIVHLTPKFVERSVEVLQKSIIMVGCTAF